MKKIICFLFILYPVFAICQSPGYFQQKADYNIDVELDTANRSLNGFIYLSYTNNSPDTLTFIWFHLWPNAYKNDRTAFSEQLLKNGRTDFYFSDESQRGYINKLNFTVDGVAATLEDHPLYIDVAKLILPEPLLPGQTIQIHTPFHEKLPHLFSRGGYAEGQFLITQWYPKPAVYDREGWHPMPYLDQGEFYSEFGDYEVNITLPAEYVVAATGTNTKTETTNRKKTVTFYQKNVHDFAWFADKYFIIDSTSIKSSSGHSIMLYAYHHKDSDPAWKNALDYIESTVRNREEEMGAYPYATISVVEAPSVFEGGMEYPTITSIQPVTDDQTLQELIDHEVGHNWNYGILATNERAFPWMDEGINSYFTKLSTGKTSSGKTSKNFISKRLPENFEDVLYRYTLAEKTDQPMDLSAQEYSEINYFTDIYYKPVLWLQKLKETLGAETFREGMRSYYDQWKFKHPYPEDFKKVFEETSGRNLDSIFDLLKTKGDINPRTIKQFKISSFFNLNQTDKYNYLFIAPAIGYNHYDKLMVGMLMHNYTLPEPPFHFFMAPMIGTGSGTLTGIGRIGYSFTSYGKIRKIEPSLAASRFDMNSFTDSTGKKNFMDFVKIVPALQLTFRNNDPLSRSEKFLQWKTYLISEKSLAFRRDTVHNTEIISYPQTHRYLNELAFVNNNSRELFPFSYKAMVQQGDGFLRITADINHYFNYPKEGGLLARIFAGKLIYTDQSVPRWRYGRYRFNMTGPNGLEDYTYSNYFLGRNEYDGLASQQIMIRDGGFKVRTDLLNNKVGTSDNWLSALNLSTDIPSQINPLQVLPFHIGLKAFMDLGTYSGAWEKDAETGKILFDAGLQLDLIKGLVKIYIPVIYSKVYRDYYRETLPPGKKFWKTISFNIDVRSFNLKKFLELPN